MFKPSRSVLSFGAGALALGVLMLAAPRAARAIAATLVQVTNTAANPAVAQSPNTQAAQLVTLGLSEFTIPGSGGWDYFVPVSAAGVGAPFTVPANQSLVVTDIDFAPTCTNSAYFYLNPNTASDVYFANLLVPAGITTHIEYHSGFVFPPGSTPGGSLGGCTSVFVLMHGYLTSN
jgi:hypothetical protein